VTKIVQDWVLSNLVLQGFLVYLSHQFRTRAATFSAVTPLLQLP